MSTKFYWGLTIYIVLVYACVSNKSKLFNVSYKYGY